jgi:protein-disulfide isomerase-like protein with CxxC motif
LKKFWIGVFAIAALLAGAAATGIVVAQDSNSGEDTAPKTILGRVAAILGLEKATVEDAFQQARKDQRTQAYREMLNRRVEKGRMTSEEAEEQFLWFQSDRKSTRLNSSH